MTREQLFQMHSELCSKGLELMKKKNADYSATDDPFGNFVASLTYGVHPVIGILIRIGDKFKRIESFIKKGHLEVSDETVEDAFIDVINYSILAAAMLREGRLRPIPSIPNPIVGLFNEPGKIKENEDE